jgi:hypothetical protein
MIKKYFVLSMVFVTNTMITMYNDGVKNDNFRVKKQEPLRTNNKGTSFIGMLEDLWSKRDKRLYESMRTNITEPLQTLKNTLTYPLNIMKRLSLVGPDFICDTDMAGHQPQNFCRDVFYLFLVGGASYLVIKNRQAILDKLWFLKCPFLRSPLIEKYIQYAMIYYFTVGQVVNIANNLITGNIDGRNDADYIPLNADV